MSKKFGKSNKSQGSGNKLTSEQYTCIQAITTVFPNWDELQVRELCVKHSWKLDRIQAAVVDILDFSQPENEWNAVKPASTKKSTNTYKSEYNSERGGASLRGGRGGVRGGLSSRPNRDDARRARAEDGEKRSFHKDGDEKRSNNKDGEKRTFKDGDRKRPAKEERKTEEKKEAAKPTGPSWASIAAKGSNTTTVNTAPVFEDYVMVDEVPVSTAAMTVPAAQEAVAKKPAAGVWGLNKASGASVVTGTAGVLVKEPVASPSWATAEPEEPVFTAPAPVEEPVAAPIAAPIPEPIPEPVQETPAPVEAAPVAAPSPAPVPQRAPVQRTAPGVVFSNAPTGFGNYTFGAPAPAPAVEAPVEAAPAPVEAAPTPAPAPVTAPVEAEKPVEAEQQPEEEYDQHDAGEYDPSMMYNMGMYNYPDYNPHHQQRRGGARGGGSYRPQPPRPSAKAGAMGGMPMQPNMHMMYNQQQYYGGNIKPEAYGDDRKQQRPTGQPMSGKHSPVAAPQQYQQGPNDMMLPGKKPYANPNVGGYKNQYPKNYNNPQAGGNPKAKNSMNQHYYNQNMYMNQPPMPYGMYGGYPQYPYYHGNRAGGYNPGYYPEPYYPPQGDEDYSQGQDGQPPAPQQGQQDYEWDKEKKPSNSYGGYNQYMVPQQQQQQQQQQNNPQYRY